MRMIIKKAVINRPGELKASDICTKILKPTIQKYISDGFNFSEEKGTDCIYIACVLGQFGFGGNKQKL